jgi:hypothetical protein
VHSSVRTVALTGADQAAAPRPCIFRGVVVRETAGAVASLRIFDNASTAAGTVVAAVSLVANEAKDVALPFGVWAEAGLFVDIISGTIEGSVRVG